MTAPETRGSATRPVRHRRGGRTRGGPDGHRHRAGDDERGDRRLNRQHTIFSWSIQSTLDPIAIDHAEGVYLYTPEGQRFLDFNSQLMS